MSLLQDAYKESCLTYNFNPDAERIWIARSQYGMFVVISESTAHCPVTDATLPTRVRHFVSCHAIVDQAQSEARRLTREAAKYQDYETRYVILGPKTDRKHWRGAVVSMASEFMNMDRNDTRRFCASAANNLNAAFNQGVPPGEAALIACRRDPDFNEAEWQRIYRPAA